MTAPTPDPTAGERPHDCDGWDSCPNPAHRVTTGAPDLAAGEGLSEAEREALEAGAALFGWAGLDEAHAHLLVAVERIVAAHVSAAATRARAEVESQLGEQADIEREAFGRGVAWAMGDDSETPLARARAEGAAAEREASASVITSLRARLDAVSDLADHLAGNEAAPLIREALNGYTPTEEPKCEGRTPSDCGNPMCPAHANEGAET